VEAPSIVIPEDITPKAFYEELLPRVFRENRERAAAAMPTASQIRASLRAEVTGEGGGIWTLDFAGGGFEVKAEALPSPLVTFVQTREDWQVSITKGIGRLLARLGSAPAPAPASPGGAPRPGLTPQKVDRLRTVRGVMNFDLTGYEGNRTIRLKVIFNSATEGKDPTCTVSLTAADYRDITSGKLPPQQAFMGGKIKIAGDMGFAMQLGATLFLS
jgi:hypothetical protein